VWVVHAAAWPKDRVRRGVRGTFFFFACGLGNVVLRARGKFV